MENQENTSPPTPFYKKHWLPLLLAVLLVGFAGFHFLKINQLHSRFDKEKQVVVKEYITKIDSVQTLRLEQLIKVFSWSVRAELIRANQEEVNILFSTFVKEKGIRKVSLVDPKESTVFICSDKKDEGIKIEDPTLLTLDRITFTKPDEISVPIMGMNDKLGIMVVSVQKN
ncbi:MAG: hypothetical protein IPL49_13915 [Saprospirales bacterium]|nr:hypothetical protein [Saprospirales bacterium]MBK8491947.1 hypothetical protein [Saprospirales bacterium]